MKSQKPKWRLFCELPFRIPLACGSFCNSTCGMPNLEKVGLAVVFRRYLVCDLKYEISRYITAAIFKFKLPLSHMAMFLIDSNVKKFNPQ